MAFDTSSIRRDIRSAVNLQRDEDATRQMNYSQMVASAKRLRDLGAESLANEMYLYWIKQGGWA